MFQEVDYTLVGIFSVVIIGFLVIDLGVLNKSSHKISTKSALYQTIFWVIISLIFGVLIYFEYSTEQYSSKENFFLYLTAYLLEKALSLDNIFVILLILRYFKVKEKHYHRILFWGILGALIFRGVFIFVGAALVERFHWILYIFGIFLIYSGVKLLFENEDDEINPEKNPIIKFTRKHLKITKGNYGGKFYIIRNGALFFTPLFLVLILIETTDLIFAVDSIPAAFAITTDEFLIYTSNIFAVLGLRAMFFLLAGILDKFYLLQKGLSLILVFIGVKMLLTWFEEPGEEPLIEPVVSFIIIIGTMLLSVVMSVILPKKLANKS
ncbi:TerC family protein [Mangrovivirga cuniculi]|uniref:Tellurium resistance protein TerC n=1 Tax=Mangrovivirga cuniculi TaxID=2715131 RepID=A0A4D7JPR8_9BACT|nr:TerC family protein [Mangrovivirga cuniculi]QCK13426.1 tellurium resistance protein TerC [Mangrovivirga cuniculi]